MIVEIFDLPKHFVDTLEKRANFSKELPNGSWITAIASIDTNTMEPIYKFMIGEKPFEPSIVEQTWTKEGCYYPGLTRTEINGDETTVTSHKVATLSELNNDEDAFMDIATKSFIKQKIMDTNTFVPDFSILVRKYE